LTLVSDHRAPFVERQFGRGFANDDAGVVDERVDATHRFGRGGNGVIGFVGVGDVARAGETRAALRFDAFTDVFEQVFRSRKHGDFKPSIAR
jgi:hypothetical protein